MNDAADAHPEAGKIQGGEAPSDESGMSMDDAVSSAFDDHQRATDGIAEGERESLGKHLKFHADSAGTTVIGGLNALIEPAVALRHGDLTTKREVIGNLIDEYNVHPVPEAEPAPVAVEYGQPAHDGAGQPITTEEQALDAVAQFANEHPGAQDELVVDHMTFLAHDMRRQGITPTLEAVYHYATVNDPRFSESARQAQAQGQEAAHLARARAGAVQVAGSGNVTPSAPSDDLDAIIREQIPG